MDIVEDKNEIVSVISSALDAAGDHISEHLHESYRHRFAKARNNKEYEEKVQSTLDREIKEAREDYINRRNFKKHLKKSYWRAFLRLLWFDEVARRISNEYGIRKKRL